MKYVSREMIGYEDLDEYGTWRPAPGYGMVWYPRAVAAGWAPYRDGHWAWVEPWGWTWVDEAPWGFAPFHYGRWVYVGGAGHGCRVPLRPAQYMRPRWWRLSAERISAFPFRLEAVAELELPGSRWGRVTSIYQHIVPAPATSTR